RSQWASFPGAPKFINLAATHRVNRPADVTHNALRSGTPITTDEIPRSKRIVHAVGGTLMHISNGSQGIIETLEGGATYALHYPLNSGNTFALGVAMNDVSMRIRWDRLELGDPDPFVDNAGGSSYTNINLRSGLLLYSPRFYVHAAYLQLYFDIKDTAITEI